VRIPHQARRVLALPGRWPSSDRSELSLSAHRFQALARAINPITKRPNLGIPVADPAFIWLVQLALDEDRGLVPPDMFVAGAHLLAAASLGSTPYGPGRPRCRVALARSPIGGELFPHDLPHDLERRALVDVL